MSASFLGKGWRFPITADAMTGRMVMAEGEDDIAEAIGIILMTSRGERVMRPEFGCGLREFVFGTMNETTLGLLENEIQESITAWEPRVKDVVVSASQDRNDPGLLQLHIRYTVRTTNNLFNQVYPFYLEEGTR